MPNLRLLRHCCWLQGMEDKMEVDLIDHFANGMNVAILQVVDVEMESDLLVAEQEDSKCLYKSN